MIEYNSRVTLEQKRKIFPIVSMEERKTMAAAPDFYVRH